MDQVIYADVYLAINFTMDFLALYLTARGMKLPAHPIRLSLSALLGAGYALASLFLPGGNILSTFTTLAVPFLLLLTSFGWQGWRDTLRTLAVFWAISFLLGGAATAVSYLVAKWAKREVLIGGQVERLSGDLPYWGILVLGLLVGAVVSFLLRIRTKIPATITVEIGETEDTLISLSGLVDSGNLLVEPLSGHSVIVVDRSAASFLPPELNFLRVNGTPTLTPRLRLIPYSTPSGEGIMYGYLPRLVRVKGKPRSACIAITTLPQGERHTDAIVPANLI